MRIIINLPAEYEILPMSTTKHRTTANLIFQRAAFSKTNELKTSPISIYAQETCAQG